MSWRREGSEKLIRWLTFRTGSSGVDLTFGVEQGLSSSLKETMSLSVLLPLLYASLLPTPSICKIYIILCNLAPNIHPRCLEWNATIHEIRTISRRKVDS